MYKRICLRLNKNFVKIFKKKLRQQVLAFLYGMCYNAIMNVQKRYFTPVQKIALGFLTVILTGTALLMLPISNVNGEFYNFIDALFTATSAVCITGLSVCYVAEQFTIFGQIVLLLLIQIGGMGFMAAATLIFFIIKKKISLRDRLVLKEASNAHDISGIVKFTRNLIIATFVIESIGFCCLIPSFVPVYGGMGVFYALFIAVSAFCNAGFDNFPVYGDLSVASLSDFVSNPFVCITVMALIFIGGIGFLVVFDVLRTRSFRRISFHSKLVLVISLSLIFGGAMIYALLEWNNPDTLGELSVGGKILAAFFQSVTCRTAGFATISQADLTYGSKIITMLLMFIGGSPASTAGGIKTTTIFVLVLFALQALRQQEITVRRHTLSTMTLRKATALSVFSLMIIGLAFFAVSVAEQNSGFSFDALLFETISAFGTVGLSTGITPYLSDISIVVLTMVMYCGRIGPLSLGVLFVMRNNPVKIKYADARLLIG